MTAAAQDLIEIFGKMLQEKFDTRRIGMIGAARHLDKELEVLHRSVRVINDELMEIEADRHSSWSHEKQSNTPSSRTSKRGADSIECHALHTVVSIFESSWPPSSTETNVRGTN